MKLSDRVVSGEQLATGSCAVKAGGDGFNPGVALPDFKVPTLGTSVNSIFLYHDSAVLDVGVGQVGVLTGCDGGVLFHIHIVFPVAVHPLVVEFSDRVVSGEQVTADGFAVSSGGDGFNPGISLPDFKSPALGTSVDGVLLYHNSAPVDIVYGDSCGLTCNHRNGVTGGVQLPVGVTASNFTDDVLPGRKIGGCGQTLGIGGNGFYHLVCGFVHDFKLPSGEVLPGVGGFLHLDLALYLNGQTEQTGNRVHGAVQGNEFLLGGRIGLVLVNGTGFGFFPQLVSTGLHHQLIQLLGSGLCGCHLQGITAPGKGQPLNVGYEMEVCQHAVSVGSRAGVKTCTGILFQGDGAGGTQLRTTAYGKAGDFSVIGQLGQQLIILGLNGRIGKGIIERRSTIPGRSIQIPVAGNHVPDAQGSCLDCGI